MEEDNQDVDRAGDESETSALEAALSKWVKPLLEADGGGIALVGVSGDEVTVRLDGACGGCPGAPRTKASIILPVVRRVLGRPVTVLLERTPVLASLKTRKP